MIVALMLERHEETGFVIQKLVVDTSKLDKKNEFEKEFKKEVENDDSFTVMHYSEDSFLTRITIKLPCTIDHIKLLAWKYKPKPVKKGDKDGKTETAKDSTHTSKEDRKTDEGSGEVT